MMSNPFPVSRLADVVTFRTGKLNSNASVPHGEYPFFTCSQETFRTNTYSFDTECVLLAGNNANGVFPIKYYKGKFDAYQRTYVIESMDEATLSTRFLFYVLQPKLSHFQSVSTGVATKFLTLTILNETSIPLPPLPVQNKIAAILSAYDDLIENNTCRIQLLEEMARSVYEEWFVRFRFPGHENVNVVDSELGPIPEGWQVVAFSDLADVLSGGTPHTGEPEYWNGEIPFFTPKDVADQTYAIKTEKHITRLGLSKCNSQLYPKDTVFVTARGTVGKIALASRDMAMNQSCYALKDRTGAGQLYVFLSIQSCVERLKQTATGGVFDTIVVNTFQRLRIAKPPKDLLRALTGTVEPLFAEILNLQLRTDVLRQTRDHLLPKLISGQVDVSHLDIQTELAVA